MTSYFFSSKNYDDTSKNYGDCFLQIINKNALIYDCGSEEHAMRLIEELDKHGISQADIILSHNDDDHFKGIPFLIKKNRVRRLYTILLLKHSEKILDELDDNRHNKDSIKKQLLDAYDNISSLSGKIELLDIYEDGLPESAVLIGPDFDYMISAVAKGIDNSQGDTIDGETITNAISIQIELQAGNKALLLTGDCTPDAIPSDVKISKYSYIQLPHHGKPELADKIFDRAYPDALITYLVSDNTGDSNGGADDLNRTGHNIKDTKDGDIIITESSATPYTGAKLG